MLCYIDKPYPPIKIACPNQEYGRMILDNVGGMVSEMSAIASYLYNSVISKKCPEIKEMFEKISEVEMRHLNIFCELALLLGMDPRLWSTTNDYVEYWSPAYVTYVNKLDKVLQLAIEGEQQAIEKYTFQASVIQDPNIVDILNRIILDEQLHVKIFTEYYNKLIS